MTRFQSWEPHNLDVDGNRAAALSCTCATFIARLKKKERKKKRRAVFQGQAKKVLSAHRGAARSAVGMKKETKCCEEATSHDIIVFVERPRRACRTRPLISSLGHSNHSPNLWAAGGTAANISAVEATDEVLTDFSFSFST